METALDANNCFAIVSSCPPQSNVNTVKACVYKNSCAVTHTPTPTHTHTTCRRPSVSKLMAPQTDLGKVGREGFDMLEECLGRRRRPPPPRNGNIRGRPPPPPPPPPHNVNMYQNYCTVPTKEAAEPADCVRVAKEYGGVMFVWYPNAMTRWGNHGRFG